MRAEDSGTTDSIENRTVENVFSLLKHRGVRKMSYEEIFVLRAIRLRLWIFVEKRNDQGTKL